MKCQPEGGSGRLADFMYSLGAHRRKEIPKVARCFASDRRLWGTCARRLSRTCPLRRHQIFQLQS